jgi:hypothetical protein
MLQADRWLKAELGGQRVFKDLAYKFRGVRALAAKLSPQDGRNSITPRTKSSAP